MGIDVRLNNKLICSHCGNDCDGSISAYDSSFCCNGCKVVYGLLNEKGFCDYYKFNDRPGLTIRSNISQSKYDYLDQEDIKQKLYELLIRLMPARYSLFFNESYFSKN